MTQSGHSVPGIVATQNEGLTPFRLSQIPAVIDFENRRSPKPLGWAMRRRSRASSVKSRRRKPAARKRASGTKAARPRSSAVASPHSEAARLASELSAMGGILRLIANSPSNATAVLQSVAEQAAQICQAQYVDIFVLEHDNL